MGARVARVADDDPLLAVMPRVSRALKRGDRREATRALERVVGIDVANRAVAAMTAKPRRVGFAPTGLYLTPAEWAAVWNAGCGLTAADAGARFNRATDTVLSARKSALKKLGVGTIAGAVAECYRRGIFDRKDVLEPVDW